MADPFVAEIRIFPFNFAPKGWAWCNGQLMPLSQNTALFSLLGTTYGGDGKSTFALPDLEGRAPMHPGQALGCRSMTWGRQVAVRRSRSWSPRYRRIAMACWPRRRRATRKRRPETCWRARPGEMSTCLLPLRRSSRCQTRRSRRRAATSRTTTCSRI